MKTLKITNYFILPITVFLIVFVSPFINFSAKSWGDVVIANSEVAKFFAVQISLGALFGLIGLVLIFIKNKIFKNIVFLIQVIVALVIAAFLGKFFSMWSNLIINGILPMVFIVIYLIIEFIQVVKDFQKNKVKEIIIEKNEPRFENEGNYDLKAQISNLKENLSKPSFQILEEIDSTGSFAGINMENILDKDLSENDEVAKESDEPVEMKIVNLPKSTEAKPEKIEENSEKTEEKEPIKKRREYDYNDLTELSFEQNKNREDFEIIKPRRSDSEDKKIKILEVDDE